MLSLPTTWNQPGRERELLRLAIPFILSNSVWTLQITIDRIFMSQLGPEVVGAAMFSVLLFWTPMNFFQNTAGYATTFVSQYVGARRPLRVGPVVWQSLYFALFGGCVFLLFLPFVGQIVAWGDHSSAIQSHEEAYFRCLCYAALPTLITASASSFFAGRGLSWTVFWINTAGLVVNAALDYAWIFGHWGFPALGIEGAGWATVAGTWCSALLSLGLLFRPAYRREFGTLNAVLEWPLMGRLMRYGAPSGLQWALDCLAFTIFTLLVGRLGDAELASTSIAFTLNLVVVLPAMGICQAVGVLVGQRLGEDAPRLAERTTWTGFRLTWSYMATVALAYVLAPDWFLAVFNRNESDLRDQVAVMVPILLRFVAVYSLFDSMNLVFSFALKGAGDTRFVTIVSLVLAWPLMVVPTWAAWSWGWGLYWSWGFASAYIVALALVFLWRFLAGPWRTMRVIEPEAHAPELVELEPVAESACG